MLIICCYPVVETDYLIRCSLWSFYTVQQNLFPDWMKAATILQNLVPLKSCCLMLITEGCLAEVHYICPCTCLPVTVGTKGGCLRNSELPLAWYKPHPLFPLSIALMDHNSFKPLYTHTHTHTHTYTWHSFLPVTSCHLHKMQSPCRQTQYIPSKALEHGT
jgi:hypothetical protein